MDGLRYFQGGGVNIARLQPLSVETYAEFEVSVNVKASWVNAPTGRILTHPFCGYIDMIARDEAGALCIVDHKSRALKERGPRRHKSNVMLDEYLRQL
jgi:ATP-dependent exoDNAse (exonuclease V) beta subunit